MTPCLFYSMVLRHWTLRLALRPANLFAFPFFSSVAADLALRLGPDSERSSKKDLFAFPCCLVALVIPILVNGKPYLLQCATQWPPVACNVSLVLVLVCCCLLVLFLVCSVVFFVWFPFPFLCMTTVHRTVYWSFISITSATHLFFRPTPYGSRQVVKQAGKPVQRINYFCDPKIGHLNALNMLHANGACGSTWRSQEANGGKN